MKRFRLNMTLLSLCAVMLAIICGWQLSAGKWAFAILALIGCGCCIWGVSSLVSRLKQIMTTFVSALEMNDHTLRFDIGRDDHSLKKMSDAMNRISALYHHNLIALETRKLYYDRILRIMTHEMRNSITPVIALTSDYAAHPEKYGTEDLEETMSVIRDQSLGIKKFLDAYYTLTHLPEPNKKSINATDLMHRIRKVSQLEEIERGMRNVCRFTTPKDLELSVDADLIAQAVINLIRNALDAVMAVESPAVEITISLSGGKPFISISDNGCGIPENIKENLFQPFVTTKAGGSGIGLSFSRQIARCHNGDLTISSTPHGTTATLTLP